MYLLIGIVVSKEGVSMAKRPDGDGTIRKRTDGRWEGIIIIGHKADGKPIRKSVFASTQKELLPKLHQLIEDYVDYSGTTLTSQPVN